MMEDRPHGKERWCLRHERQWNTQGKGGVLVTKAVGTHRAKVGEHTGQRQGPTHRRPPSAGGGELGRRSRGVGRRRPAASSAVCGSRRFQWPGGRSDGTQSAERWPPACKSRRARWEGGRSGNCRLVARGGVCGGGSGRGWVLVGGLVGGWGRKSMFRWRLDLQHLLQRLDRETAAHGAQ